MISAIISRLVILLFGTLYPAYASYKAVRTKNLKEYVKWMMYWIVFALFTCTETITDVFFSWFPFYYEVKIVLVLWLLSPATKGSSILYRKFVHPALCRREQEIDEYIAKAKDQGYHTVLNLGTKGVNYATTVIMQTAIKGGGGLVQQLRKSYSLSDLSECEPRAADAGADEADDVLTEPRLIRRQVTKSMYNTRRSASESNSRSPLYFPEVDVAVRDARPARDDHDFSHIKSSEDISSGYSSADNSGAQVLRAGQAGVGGAKVRTRAAARAAVTAIKRPTPAEDSEVIIEEMVDDDSFDYTSMPPLLNLPSPLYLSQTDPPFIYQYVGDEVKIIQVLANFPTNNDATNNYIVDKEKVTNDTHDKTVSNYDNNKENKIIGNDSNLNEMQGNSSNETLSEGDNVIRDKENTEHDCHIKKVVLPLNRESTPTNIKDVPEMKSNDFQNNDVNFSVEVTIEKDDYLDSISLDTTSFTENGSAESDDEASYGTPDNSPKSRRKSPSVGKYGKRKAPSPPKFKSDTKSGVEKDADKIDVANKDDLNDILNALVDFTDIPSTSKSFHVNPIAEKKKRHKSKSPGRIPKASNSAIGKLLQLPGKFPFWGKNEKAKTDSWSTSSGDESQKSSTTERIDIFQSSLDLHSNNDEVLTTLHTNTETNDSLDFTDLEGSVNISKDILDKSDNLKKLIEAKIETHPEYKYVALQDEEIPTCSKSTEV